MPVNGDFVTRDENNSAGAFADTRDTLGEPGKLSGVQFSPKILILWVDKKMSHFHELAGFLVKDCIEEVGRE